MKIEYRSTNGFPRTVDFKTAILRGQAPDKGLYMPDRIPKLSLKEIESMFDMTYQDIAFVVANHFLESEVPQAELMRIVPETYNFSVPVQGVYDRKYVMWLSKGPTLSFKDFAMRMMSRLMRYYMMDEGRRMTILTATSGDTGSAAANAFYNIDNIDCVVLFPENEVTDLQRKQMTTLGKNVVTFAVDGKFDDCQAMVKRAFADPDFDHLNLSSANSINFGRLLPQLIQYFYAYSRVVENTGEEPIMSVPCGNFGHITAGLLAKSMGLPVHKYIVATNANDEFPKFLETGVYKPVVPSRVCISNAMNVGNPSNLARIVDLYGGSMNEKGEIMKMPDMDSMRRDMFAVSISDEETETAMKEVYGRHGIILEPHGAVAWAGLIRYLDSVEDWEPCVSFETADPGKFSEEVVKTLGVNPETPMALKKLEGKEEKYFRVSKDYDAFKELLRKLLQD